MSLSVVLIFVITFILQESLAFDNDSTSGIILQRIDEASVTFFTMEYIIRFSCSPNKKRFFKNIMNLVDLLAIIPFYINLFLNQITDIAILGMAGKTVRLVRVLRIIRIFKLIRHFAGLQSLMHTVYEAYKELGLLMLLVALAELTFAVLIFYAERQTPKATANIFKYDEDDTWSFVECLWFCLMTLTTVGGSLKYPSSGLGQLVGGVCAVVGVLIISLPLPIVVNSFARSYKNQLWQNKLSQRRSQIFNQIQKRNTVSISITQFVTSFRGFPKTSTAVAKQNVASLEEYC